MVQFFAFHKFVRLCVLAIGSFVLFSSVTPASAKSHHHRAGRHAHAHHFVHHARHHHHRHRYHYARRGRHIAPRDVAAAGTIRPVSSPAASFGSSNIVAEARRYIGGNPTGRGRLWCARFMNLVLERSGHRGSGSDMARSFASYGQRISGPQIGAIAVMGRRGGGHVGVVSGIDPNGNPIVVSGNHNHRVAESVYSRSRIYAYVMPTS